MHNITTRLLAVAAAMFMTTTIALADDSRPYSEGPVTEVTFIKIMPGMFEPYMKWLATDRKRLMDEYKKAGIILDTKVYGSRARGPNDADLILTVTYKNMAALDGMDERTAAIDEKIAGPEKVATEAMIGREKMRQVLGSELIRELVLK